MRFSAFSQLKAALNRVIHKEMYLSEFVGYTFVQMSEYLSPSILKGFLLRQGMKLCITSSEKKLMKYYDGQKFNFKGACLPDVRSSDILFTRMSHQYNDLFRVHCDYEGNYHYKIVDPMDQRFPEGTYFYVGPNDEKIIIKPGDVVIDAGAWIGDFSALAAHLVGDSGRVYAFEPSAQTRIWLQKTVSFYSNITIVPVGVGSSNQTLFYDDQIDGNGTFLNSQADGSSMCEIKKLDDWVSENHIDRIDFIKADIEGLEREMLLGAKRVMRDFAPILSICTYHLPDDPQVLEKMILEANPAYRIIQRRCKLFAYVPRNNHNGF